MRITKKMLEAKISDLNLVTGSPISYYKNPESKDYVTSIDHFCLDCAYGGYSLHRVCNEHGGVNDRYCYGRHTARELYDRINAMIEGYQLAKEGSI